MNTVQSLVERAQGIQLQPQFLHQPQVAKTRTLFNTKGRLEIALGLINNRRRDAGNLVNTVQSHVTHVVDGKAIVDQKSCI